MPFNIHGRDADNLCILLQHEMIGHPARFSANRATFFKCFQELMHNERMIRLKTVIPVIFSYFRYRLQGFNRERVRHSLLYYFATSFQRNNVSVPKFSPDNIVARTETECHKIIPISLFRRPHRFQQPHSWGAHSCRRQSVHGVLCLRISLPSGQRHH